MHLRRVVVRLRMIAVDFADAVRFDPALQQLASAADGKANIGQAALVGALARIADDDRQRVDAQVVVVAPRPGAADEKAAIAAAQVKNDRRSAAEEIRPVEAALAGHFLECSLRPLRRVKDLAGEGDAELALDSARRIVHVSAASPAAGAAGLRSEEHTSELQSL